MTLNIDIFKRLKKNHYFRVRGRRKMSDLIGLAIVISLAIVNIHLIVISMDLRRLARRK